MENDDLPKLKEKVNKLKVLLDDSQPGLFIWNVMLSNLLEEISKFKIYIK